MRRLRRAIDGNGNRMSWKVAVASERCLMDVYRAAVTSAEEPTHLFSVSTCLQSLSPLVELFVVAI